MAGHGPRLIIPKSFLRQQDIGTVSRQTVVERAYEAREVMAAPTCSPGSAPIRHSRPKKRRVNPDYDEDAFTAEKLDLRSAMTSQLIGRSLC